MQIVVNKCFLLNPKKDLAQVRLVVFEKNAKTANSDALQFRKSDITKPKNRKFGYSNN